MLSAVNRWKIKSAVIEYNHMIMRHSNVTQKYKNSHEDNWKCSNNDLINFSNIN
jgi:hypothetical protein